MQLLPAPSCDSAAEACLPCAVDPASLVSAFRAALDDPDGPEAGFDEDEASLIEPAFEEPPEAPDGITGPEPEEEGPPSEPEPACEWEVGGARDAVSLFESGRKARRAPPRARVAAQAVSQCSASSVKAASPVQAPSNAERRFEALRDRIRAKEAAAKRPRLG